MVQWVFKNTTSFGGDPNKIVINGESASAGSVRTLFGSPKTAGKFRDSIAISNLGGGVDLGLTGNYATTYSSFLTPAESYARSEALFGEIGCNQTTLDTRASCLRSAPAQTIAAQGICFTNGGVAAQMATNTQDPGGTPAHTDTGTVDSGGTDDGTVTQDADGDTNIINNDTSKSDSSKPALVIRKHCIYHPKSVSHWTKECSKREKFLANPSQPGHPAYNRFLGSIDRIAHKVTGVEKQRKTKKKSGVQEVSKAMKRTSLVNPNPPASYVQVRGYTNTTQGIKESGPWQPVANAQGPMKLLDFPSLTADFQDLPQCAFLNYSINYYIDGGM
ncbi:hypothetical protein KCU65_g7378, partial [Aureobasidium melanogenum]